MTASDNVQIATSALGQVARLIELEAADAAEDASEGSDEGGEDAADVALLRGIAADLNKYIAATTAEIGTPDDLEEIADAKVDMNARIRASLGYPMDY